MKNTGFYLFLFFTLIPLTITAEINRDYHDDEEEISFFDFEGSNVPDLEIGMMKDSCDLSIFDVVDYATSEGDGVMIQNLLALQFYKFTNPPVIRSLVSNPVLNFGRVNPNDGCNRFSAKLFYKEMRKSYLRPCSPYLNSYLAVFTDPELIAEIDRIGKAFNESLDIPAVFPLFENIKLEERRTGVMLGFERRVGKFEWRMLIPLYYFEHNFYLTKKEQDAIKNDPFFQRPEIPDNDANESAVEEFAMTVLVNDAFGFGDMRTVAMYDIITTDCLTVALGLEIDFPTAITLADHIVGGVDCATGKKVESCPNQPPFDLYGLVCLAQNNQTAAQAAGYEFGTGALRRLTEVVAQAPLGSRRVDIAGRFEWYVKLNDTVTWRNQFRLAYLTPANEKRFLRSTKNPADFNRDYGDPLLAEENNAFLSEQIALFLYPPVTSIHSHPGITTQYTTGLTFNYSCYQLDLGYDYWHREHDSFKVLSSPVPVDCYNGIRPSAEQNKLFAIFSFDRSDSCNDWRFGLFGDITVASKGMGKDWCAGLDISLLF
jgi:hypothetical protein